jgi:hypothetical protein
MVSWVPQVGSRTVLLVLLCLAGAAPASADSTDVNALRQEIQELRGAVERLDARVRALEQQRPEPAASQSGASATGPAPAAATPGLRDRWQHVERGMTTQEIEALLGRPTRTMKLTPKTIWYYSYTDIGNGSVVFTDDSVSDWQSPPLNTWWGF